MAEYLVRWEIDSGEAASPLAAARWAREVQEDPRSWSTVFLVTDQGTGETFRVDLEVDSVASTMEPGRRLSVESALTWIADAALVHRSILEKRKDLRPFARRARMWAAPDANGGERVRYEAIEEAIKVLRRDGRTI